MYLVVFEKPTPGWKSPSPPPIRNSASLCTKRHHSEFLLGAVAVCCAAVNSSSDRVRNVFFLEKSPKTDDRLLFFRVTRFKTKKMRKSTGNINPIPSM